jgi:hypothetical protein
VQKPDFRVGERGLLRRLRSALFNADPKPNFHYDNDRKLKEQIQGYEAVNFLSLKIPEDPSGKKISEHAQLTSREPECPGGVL